MFPDAAGVDGPDGGLQSFRVVESGEEYRKMPRLTGCLRVVATCIAGYLLGGCVSSPPVQEMSDARQAIALAVNADAARYAPALLADAQQLIVRAEAQIREESYGRARANALRAKDRAQRALASAADNAEPANE